MREIFLPWHVTHFAILLCAIAFGSVCYCYYYWIGHCFNLHAPRWRNDNMHGSRFLCISFTRSFYAQWVIWIFHTFVVNEVIIYRWYTDLSLCMISLLFIIETYHNTSKPDGSLNILVIRISLSPRWQWKERKDNQQQK